MQKLFKMITIIFLLICLIFITKKFLLTDFFYVRDVEIKGEITNKELKSQLENNIKHLIGKNINFIDEKKVEKQLVDDVRVKEITVEKKYPSKIILNVENREPYVYIKNGNNFYLADRELNLFGYAEEFPNGNIPIVFYNNEEERKNIIDILSNIKSENLYNVISEIKKDSNRDSYELILLNGVKIITNGEVSSEIYDKVIKLYEKIKTTQPVNYIDIRYKNISVK